MGRFAGNPVSFPISAISRLEHVGDISISAVNSENTLPTQGGVLPNDMYLFGLRFEIEGRATMPAANGPTGINADGIFALLESIVIEGYHRPRGQREQFLNLRGPELRELSRLYSRHDPLVTYAVDGVSAAAMSVTADKMNDFRFVFDVPFVPAMLPPSKQLGWLLDAPNYDNLQMKVKIGDSKSVFSGGTVAAAFSAYGSATGSMRVRVARQMTLGGTSRFAGFLPGRIWRYFSEITAGDIVSGNTGSRLFTLPRGYMLRSILVKTGAKATVTAGNNAYSTLTDNALHNIRIYRGINKLVREFVSPSMLKEETGMRYGLTPNTGYNLIDFVQHGTDQELFNTSSLVAGPTGDVDCYLQADITAGAGQAALMAVEEWRNQPVMASLPRIG